MREQSVSSTSSVEKKRFVAIRAIRGQKSKHPGESQAQRVQNQFNSRVIC